jgi:quercetin dioxygenase-like cupin family protein
MIEKVYEYSIDGEGVIEKVVDKKDLSIAHAVIEPGEKFPKHAANANVHIIVIKGKLSAMFNGQDANIYTEGNILGVEKGTRMEISNAGEGPLEFFAVKAPSPTFK